MKLLIKLLKLLPLLLLTGVAILQAQIIIPANFSTTFTQKVTNPKKNVIQYSGSVLLSNSTTLKWSYRKPTQKEVCSNGTDVTVIDHDLEQVSFYRMKKGLNLPSILEKARLHKGNLYVATYQEKHYTIQVDREGRISQIAYTDELDNVVNIHFHTMRYSSKPNDAKKMRCTIPKSYDMMQ